MAGSQRCLLPLAHKGTAPFLHMGALAAITALSWIVAGQFARAERSCKYDQEGPAPQPRPPLGVPWVPWEEGGLALGMALGSSQRCLLPRLHLRPCLCVSQRPGSPLSGHDGAALVQGLFRACVS